MPFADRRLGAGQSLQLRQKDEMFQHFHLLVQAAFFGQVTELVHVSAAEGFSEDRNFAGIGHDDAHDHADRAGLTRAVGPEQSVDSRRNAQGEIVHRDKLVIAFADAAEFYDIRAIGFAICGRSDYDRCLHRSHNPSE
jgi:hypothetical protein